ncbi:hypothetical protein YT1_5037 [Rhodococcus ruber]|nr:hypothetical protein YT1_5037 [Rhodococcus ruber]
MPVVAPGPSSDPGGGAAGRTYRSPPLSRRTMPSLDEAGTSARRAGRGRYDETGPDS